MSKNLITRISVALIGIPVFLSVAYEGGVWLLGLVAMLTLVGSYEFLKGEKTSLANPVTWLFVLSVLLLLTISCGYQNVITNLVGGWFDFVDTTIVLISFFVLGGMIQGIGKASPPDLFSRHARLCWGLIYLGLLFPFVFKVGQGFGQISGGDMLLFLFAILWTGDTSAMGFGKWLGKHKLAPSVSPGKTVEGFIGALVGVVLIALVMYYWKLSAIPMHHVIICAVGVSVFSQLGDLVESMWKRSIGIKDSSALIPGHGGVLDRFDSLLFGAPFLYAYFKLFVV